MSHATTFGATYGSASVRQPRASFNAVRAFGKMRAALPTMPEDGSTVSVTASVALRVALAAIPFGALSYLFFAV